MQHPAFNAQHAQMLLARGMMGGVPHHHPPMYRPPPSNGLFQGLDHGPLPPGAAARMRLPHPGMHGSVIRQPGGGQHIPASSASYQPPQQVNGVSAAALQARNSGGHPARKEDTLHRIPQIAAQASNLPESAHNKVDISSAKGIFGWTSIDGVDIPFLLRDDKKYLAVRMVEMKLLSKYPSTYPDELKHRPPLMSHYITENEAKILNEINKQHCAGEYGQNLFVTQDLIVKMSDFEEFYNIVKKHFPPNILAQFPSAQATGGSQQKKSDGGWIQINNTVVPYVFRNKARYVPLSVIRYAAGLLTDVRVDGENPKEEECSYLNESCKTAGVEFNFVRTTKLVMLDLVQRLCSNNISLSELPKDDPFSQAEYQGSPEEEKHDESAPSQGGSMSLSTNQMPYPGPSNRSSNLGSSNGPSPPSAAAGTSVSQSSSQGNNVPFWMNQHLGIYPGHPGGFPPGGPHMMRGPGRPPLAPGIPHQPHPHQAGPPASLANHIPNRPSSQGTHISPNANQFNPKSAEVNNNSFGGSQRRPSHEAMDLSRDLVSPREKKDHSNPPTPSGTPLGRTLSSSSLSQATTPVPRTSSAGSGSGGIQRSTPDGSPQIQLQPGPPGLVPGIPTLNPSLQMGPDGHPVLGSLVPPGHPGWHPMMNNPVEYHKMVQIMQLQAMAQQQQQQQHQLQQQLQMLEQQHLQQQRLKQHESMSKMSRTGPRNDVPRSAATGVPQIRGRSIPSSSQSQPSPSSQQASGQRTPTAGAAQGTVNKSSLNQAVIQRVEFQGKTLSCIVKGERKEYYALVEALSRVYFPNCTLEEFQFALEKSLQVPLVKLTEEEERSFISFYNIPTKTLMCNKVIRLAEFQELIPQLKCMFRDKIPGGDKITDPGMPPRSTVLVTAQGSKDSKQSTPSSEVRGSPSSTPGTPSVNPEALGKISAALKAYMGKRPAPSDTESTDGTDSPGPSKQPKVSLEEAVNRLKQFQAEQKSKRKSTRPERRTGSQSPTSDTPTEYQARSPESDSQNMTEPEPESFSSAEKDDPEQKMADESAPMEVDSDEPALPLDTPSQQTESSATDDSVKVPEQSAKETINEHDSNAETIAQSEKVDTEAEALDFSAKKDSSGESINGPPPADGVENLTSERKEDVDGSTGEWTNTQPETAPDDLLLHEGLHKPDNTTALPTIHDSQSGVEHEVPEVLNLAVNLKTAPVADTQVNDQEICLPQVIDNPDVSGISTIASDAQKKDVQVPESESTDYEPTSKEVPKTLMETQLENNKDSIQEEQQVPLEECTSLPTIRTDIVDSGLVEPEGDSVLSDQPVDLHSAPDAPTSAACGEDISQVEKTFSYSLAHEPVTNVTGKDAADSKDISNEMTTKTASEESMLEFAEAQSSSNMVIKEQATNSEEGQEPCSVGDSDLKVNELVTPTQVLGTKPNNTSLDILYNTQSNLDLANTASMDIVNNESEPQADNVITESPTGLDLTTTPEKDQLKVPLVVDDAAHALDLVKTSVETREMSPMKTESEIGESQQNITEEPNQKENSKAEFADDLDDHGSETTTAIETISPEKICEDPPVLSDPEITLTGNAPCSDSTGTSDSLSHPAISAETEQTSTESALPLSVSMEENEKRCEIATNIEEDATPILKGASLDITNTTASNEPLEQTNLQICPETPDSEQVLADAMKISTTPQDQDMVDSDEQVPERLKVVHSPAVAEEPKMPVMGLFPGLGSNDDEEEEEESDISSQTDKQFLLAPADQSHSEDTSTVLPVTEPENSVNQTISDDTVNLPAVELKAVTTEHVAAEDFKQVTTQVDSSSENITETINKESTATDGIPDVTDVAETSTTEATSTETSIEEATMATANEVKTITSCAIDSEATETKKDNKEITSVVKIDHLANPETAGEEADGMDQTSETDDKNLDKASNDPDTLEKSSDCEEKINHANTENSTDLDVKSTVADTNEAGIVAEDMNVIPETVSNAEQVASSESSKEETTATTIEDSTEISSQGAEEIPMDIGNDDTKVSQVENDPNSTDDGAIIHVMDTSNETNQGDISTETDNQNTASDDSIKADNPQENDSQTSADSNLNLEVNSEVQPSQLAMDSDLTSEGKSTDEPEAVPMETGVSTSDDMDVTDPDLEAKLLASPPYTTPQSHTPECSSEAVLLGLDSDNATLQNPDCTMEDKSNATGEVVSDSVSQENEEEFKLVLESASEEKKPEDSEKASDSAIDSTVEEEKHEGSDRAPDSDKDTGERESSGSNDVEVEGPSSSGEGQQESSNLGEGQKVEQSTPVTAPSDPVVSEQPPQQQSEAEKVVTHAEAEQVVTNAEAEKVVTNADTSSDIAISSTSEVEEKEPAVEGPQEDSKVILTVTSSQEATTEGLENNPDIATIESPNVNISTEMESNSCL